jgi:hypothetical protein
MGPSVRSPLVNLVAWASPLLIPRPSSSQSAWRLLPPELLRRGAVVLVDNLSDRLSSRAGWAVYAPGRGGRAAVPRDESLDGERAVLGRDRCSVVASSLVIPASRDHWSIIGIVACCSPTAACRDAPIRSDCPNALIVGLRSPASGCRCGVSIPEAATTTHYFTAPRYPAPRTGAQRRLYHYYSGLLVFLGCFTDPEAPAVGNGVTSESRRAPWPERGGLYLLFYLVCIPTVGRTVPEGPRLSRPSSF